MIPLMKNAFLNESETKKDLSDFIAKSGRLSMGEQCGTFEKSFAQFQGAKEAILFNSGGSANLAILQVLKNLGRVHSGDIVAFSALTWATNVMPIIQMDLKPMPVDCKVSTLNAMSKNLIELLSKENVKVFFITNALGFTGDLGKIRDVCNENNIILLEDNCEALGTKLESGVTGSFGEMSSFSFFVAHHMSTIEGGMVCTNNDEYAEMLRIVRANGWDRNLKAAQQHKLREKHGIHSEFDSKYTFYDLGYNLRPTEITGFLGNSQLKYLEESNLKRNKNYKLLESVSKQNLDFITLDHSHINFLSSFALPIICKNHNLKEFYFSKFSKAGVEVRPMIAGNILNQPFYKKYVDQKFNLPGADKIDKCGFYCGNYADLTDLDIEILSSCLSKS
jgi:CDP-6-deoxy-D-xylo-4-hexulose-3-dehydrase